MKQIITYLTLILSLIYIPAFGQSPFDNDQSRTIWYFYDRLGLDFSGGAPTVLNDGQITARADGFGPLGEGCASFCDPTTGQLVFYTDGQTVWDRNHQIMTNGNGDLLGHISSYQSCVIVPAPGNPDLYYIFTLDDWERDDNNSNKVGQRQGFHYTVVDMTLRGGAGDVDVNQKNVPIFTELPRLTEKFAVARHCNGIDFWVTLAIVDDQETTSIFRTYPLTAAGFDPNNYVEDLIGSKTDNTIDNGVWAIDDWSKFKFSNDSRLLFYPLYKQGRIELLDFNNGTGRITGINTTIEDPNSADFINPFAGEFSHDNRYFYGLFDLSTDPNVAQPDCRIYQFDLQAADVQASANLVHSQNGYYGDMVLGPDNNLYIANSNEGALSSISAANTANPVFTLNAVTVPPNSIYTGLPIFIPPQPLLVPSVFGPENPLL